MKRLVPVAMLLLASPAAGDSVQGSRHDFSATGPGPFRAVSERSPCVFCHASHFTGEKLSARPEIGKSHRPYESTTAKSRAGAPTGASRVCLSCHDGTIAIGETRNRRITMQGNDRLPEGHRANIGTDLRKSHPVSVRQVPGKGTHAPRPGKGVHLDASGQVQCTSCHDPHAERAGDPTVGKFLLAPRARSTLCLSCHDDLAASGNGSPHASALAPSGSTLSAEGYATVAEAGCAACHRPHGASERGRLLRKGKTDDSACLDCHGSGGTAKGVGVDVAAPWAHASTSEGAHDEGERHEQDGSGRRGGIGRAKRHVACVDCHNPHASSGTNASAPYVTGRNSGVWGVDLNGAQVETARFEYEICFKCHGDTSPATPAMAAANDGIRRAFADTNLRLVFSPTAPSSHPVTGPGRNGDSPSLKAPYTAASVIYCSDCHASDRSPAAGGTGARGPHGSVHAHLLERNYTVTDPSPESPTAYALCYKCHDREVLLSDRSAFPLHRRHVVDRAAACATCHAAHGVSIDAGNARENAHLVSFNLTVVSPDRGPRPTYASEGPRRGSCNLTCHNVRHDGGAKARY